MRLEAQVVAVLGILKAGGGRTSPADARRLSTIVAAYTVALIAALALGMVASHVPQTRL